MKTHIGHRKGSRYGIEFNPGLEQGTPNVWWD